MKFMGMEIFKSGTLSDLQNQFSEIQKALKESQKLRPEHWDVYRVAPTDYNVQIPLYPINELTIYDLAMNSDVVRTVINAIKEGIFRRGFAIREIKELPDTIQKQALEGLIKRANKNGQSLKQVLKQFEQDLDILDNAYLLIAKDYFFDGNGEILDKLTYPTEIIRVHPIKMRKIADREGRIGYDEGGKRLYLSMTDRSKIYNEDTAKQMNFIDDGGRKLQVACYRGELYNGGYIYYIQEEVLHDSKYNPSLLYGYSPILSCWMKVYTLMMQDRYIMLAYQKGRPPRGILAVSTTNYKSVEKAWENLLQKTREDPHAIYPLLIENNQKSAKGTVEWINLLNNLKEMEYIESRNEMRRVIGALYKVMPMFGGDIQQSGGLNNESLQLTVTNDALEEGQETYNEKVFPFILKAFGITDYEMILEEPEEKDEIEEQRKLEIKIGNAVKMVGMGFSAEWNEEEMEFTYSKDQVNPPTEAGGQSFGETAPQTMDVREAMERFDKSKFDSFRKQIVKVYNKEKKTVEGELKKQFDIKKQDSDKFIDFITKALWAKTFDGLSKAKSEVVKNIILDAVVEKKSLTGVITKIQKAGIDKEQAENIARTESTALKNKTREFNFEEAAKEQDKEFKFKWLGPNDKRTSEICTAIKSRTKSGVTMKELKKIIKEEADKQGVQARPDDLIAHPGERHTFIKV